MKGQSTVCLVTSGEVSLLPSHTGDLSDKTFSLVGSLSSVGQGRGRGSKCRIGHEGR